MSYRAREIVEAPTGIEPAASWIEARRSVQMSYGARDVMVGLDGVEPRHTGALPLSYRPLGSVGCHAKTRTWTTELTAPDATVTSRGSGGESDSDPRAGSRRPTDVVPDVVLIQVETVAPGQRAIPPWWMNAVGPDGVEAPTSSM